MSAACGQRGAKAHSLSGASNADNAADAFYPSATFQRLHRGSPGTSSFQLLEDVDGLAPIDFSIDPFFFSETISSFVCDGSRVAGGSAAECVPEPSALSLLCASLLGLAAVRRRLRSLKGAKICQTGVNARQRGRGAPAGYENSSAKGQEPQPMHPRPWRCSSRWAECRISLCGV